MRDSTGTRFNFSVAEGVSEIIRLVLRTDGELLDLTNSAWRGHVYRLGERLEFTCEHGAGRGELLLTFPALGAGTYRWELVTAQESGEVRRALYGELVSVSSRAADLMVAEALEAEQRSLQITVPSGEGAVWRLGWQSTTISAVKASNVTVTVDSLEALVARSVEALDTAEKALEKLEGLDALEEEFKTNIRNQISINPETKHWVIAGVETSTKATGEPGKSPYIASTGSWWVWDEDFGWIDTGIMAAGKDGLDGDAVVRVRVDDYSDIPQSGETCSGLYRYYVGALGGPYDVYEWVHEFGGSARWVQTGEANDIATTEIYGLVKLGTGIPVGDGAPVGKDPEGRMRVPLATAETPGVLKLGSAVQASNAQPYVAGITKNPQGELMHNLAQGGALLHMTGFDWQWETNEHAGSPGIDAGDMTQQGFYMGLRTSSQFEQSQQDGLRLREGTTERVGGYMLARGADDERPNVIPTMADVRMAVQQAGIAYTKEEADEKFLTKTKAEADYLTKREAADTYIWQSGGVKGIALVTAETLPPGAQQKAGVLYIVKE